MLNSFKPSAPTYQSGGGWTSRLFGSIVAAGVKVTPLRAMQHTTVYACNRVLSESIASLPLVLMKKRTEGNRTIREKATDHPLYGVLHDLPNPEHTSMEYRETMVTMLNVNGGNHFSQKIRNGMGQVIELWPLDPSKIEIYRRESTGNLVYVYKKEAGDAGYPLDFEDVLHIRGLSLDGVSGISPIAYNAASIGLGIATEEFGSRFFSDGANPGGMLEVPKTLSDEAYKRLKESFEEKYKGLSRSHGTLLLEEGTQWKQATVNNNDSQFLETRKYQKSEIASIFRVPPHMINDLEKASFNNMEQMSLDFAVYSLTPWLVRIEQAMQRDLLTAKERAEGYYIKHNLSGLLRGDMKSRSEFYKTMTQIGAYCPNDVLEREDENGYEGGDVYTLPMNMTTPEQLARGANLKSQPQGQEQ